MKLEEALPFMRAGRRARIVPPITSRICDCAYPWRGLEELISGCSNTALISCDFELEPEKPKEVLVTREKLREAFDKCGVAIAVYDKRSNFWWDELLKGLGLE